jgi:hypothetical protein
MSKIAFIFIYLIAIFMSLYILGNGSEYKAKVRSLVDMDLGF